VRDLNTNLYRVDARVGLHREGEFSVDDVAERRAGAQGAQADAHVGEPARVRFPSGAPDVVEDRAADAEEAERISIVIAERMCVGGVGMHRKAILTATRKPPLHRQP
jgi:hypothetical protein